jgi:hypothetical protein
MMKRHSLLCLSLALLLTDAGFAPNSVWAQPRLVAATNYQNVLFRTKSYVAQIIWRAGVPYMSVSNNGWRVLADVRAEVLPARGLADQWTTYAAVSGDYMAYVRVSSTGEAAIEVTQSGRRLTEEYATIAPRQQPLQASTAQRTNNILTFETLDYVVRVFRQEGNLWMNLHNKKTETTELKQVPVTLVNTSNGVIYRHDGSATFQAREDVQGRRSLLILRDNAIQYRGDAL